MASAELDAVVARHGYIDKATSIPAVYTAYVPDTYAQAGAVAVGEHYHCGFVVFDVSGLSMGDATITEARLVITDITSSGSATPWEISFYSGGRLDTDDLSGSYAGGDYAFRVDGVGSSPPTAVDETLPGGRLGDLVNEDNEIVFRLQLGGYSGSDPIWKPEAQYATLHLTYVAGGIRHTLASGLANAKTLRSGRAASVELESSLPLTVTLRSGLALTVELESDRAATVALRSSLREG